MPVTNPDELAAESQALAKKIFNSVADHTNSRPEWLDARVITDAISRVLVAMALSHEDQFKPSTAEEWLNTLAQCLTIRLEAKREEMQARGTVQ